MFLVWPAVAVFGRAFERTDGAEVPAMREAMTGQYRDYFVDSLKLSAVTAVIGGRHRHAAGARRRPVAATALAAQRGRRLRRRGGQHGRRHPGVRLHRRPRHPGPLTKVITDGSGVDVPPQFIASFWGLVIVYLYFQIPLMLLVMLPAVDGLKPEWREAAANLGGTAVTYWRRVGIPVLAPAALGGMLLLFANAFAAYATAFALTTGASNLVPLQIRFYLQGNAITGKQGLGYALAAWMILIMLVTMGGYLLLRRRAERWRR